MSRRRTALLALAALLLLLPVAAWLLRHPIATHFVDRELRRRGVEGRYRVVELGFGRQVLEDVSIGPAARPDLLARRVVVRTAVGWSGLGLTGVEADGVRLRAEWRGGRLRLGQLDRLLLPPSGKPFAFPDLPLILTDARVWLATPAGRARLVVAGRGNLATRFDGRLAVASYRLASGGCVTRSVRGEFGAMVRDGAPTLDGPLTVAMVDCGDDQRLTGLRARPRLALNAGLDRLRARVPLALDRVSADGLNGQGIGGRLTMAGWTDSLSGEADLTARRLSGRGVAGEGVRLAGDFAGDRTGVNGTVRLQAARLAQADRSARELSAEGRYRIALGPAFDGSFAGRVRAGEVQLDPRSIQGLGALDQGLNGTPLDAPARAIGLAGRRAAARFALEARLAAVTERGGVRLTIREARVASASGAVLTLAGERGGGLSMRTDAPATATLVGSVSLAGGGFPDVAVRLRRSADGAVSGQARVAPYAVGGSRVAISPVRFDRSAAGATRVSTVAEVTGPFAGGRVERARLPLDLVIDRSGALVVNTACQPLSFARLSVSGVTLDPTRVALCPDAGGALLRRSAAGVLTAGARIDGLALSGRVGTTPLSLTSRRARVALKEGRFALDEVAARVGTGESVTRLDVATLDGGFRGKGGQGRFTGAAGQVGTVPIVWSQGDGEWTLTGGRLALSADLMVDDAATPARIQTLRAPDFALSFAESVIEAGGALIDPVSGRTVTEVALRHSFRSASGEATLAVRGLRFDEALQPSRLTPLALGIVAEVRGSVDGTGRIAWNGTGGGPAVESSGTFTTADMDLAAAFGPVRGLSTTVRFTDLLNLVTADDQLLRVAEINPGTAVLDGRVRYALTPGRRIAVRGGEWPFAGGRLILRPTLLDFAEGNSQSFVVDVDGLDAAVLVDALEFENIAATGVFDGQLPLVFTDGNGRVDGGRLTSRAAGGTVAYVGAVSQEDLGFFPNMAFEALKALRYDQLDITLDGPLSGSMVTAMRFDGLAQGAGARRNLLARTIQGLPFTFKIRITAPFRQLLATAGSFSDPTGLVERNLPLLYEEQRRAVRPPSDVQPQESEPLP